LLQIFGQVAANDARRNRTHRIGDIQRIDIQDQNLCGAAGRVVSPCECAMVMGRQPAAGQGNPYFFYRKSARLEDLRQIACRQRTRPHPFRL
jgi:hypothetical protein